MKKYRWKLPLIKLEKNIPRIFISEKYENRTKWWVRAFTAFGIFISVISFEWYVSLAIALVFFAIDYLIENVLFYYTSAYVVEHPTFEYQSERWVGNMFLSNGEPENPETEKVIGTIFDDIHYAEEFFNLLHSWNGNHNDLRLTFVVDEDMYYVYLYCDHESERITDFYKTTTEKNTLGKYGKEHLGLIYQLVFCKGFPTTNGFAMGLFINHHPEDKEYLFAPFLLVDNEPEPIRSIQPIEMKSYKAKACVDLTENDFEYFHWHKLVKNDRISIGKGT